HERCVTSSTMSTCRSLKSRSIGSDCSDACASPDELPNPTTCQPDAACSTRNSTPRRRRVIQRCAGRSHAPKSNFSEACGSVMDLPPGCAGPNVRFRTVSNGPDCCQWLEIAAKLTGRCKRDESWRATKSG